MSSNTVAIRTRYMYVQYEVFAALLVSILHGDENSALFWAYELMFSGTREHLGRFFRTLYDTMYDTDFSSPVINSRIERATTIIINTVARGCPRCARAVHLVVRMLVNLRPTQSGVFDDEPPVPTSIDTQKAVSANLTRLASWRVLRQVARNINEYPETGILVTCRVPVLHGDTWLDAMSTSPIWQHRRRLHNNLLTDDDVEAFHDSFDYELDEQSTEVRGRLQLPAAKSAARASWSKEVMRGARHVLDTYWRSRPMASKEPPCVQWRPNNHLASK